ncbi:MAG TPA: nucleotidyltransferase family protein [Acidimicrobiia bacterium]
MTAAALVLAGGGSRRLGRPKQLEKWGETTLLGHVLSQAAALPVEQVWVVLGANTDLVLEQVDLGSAMVVENPEWQEGIASSLRVGLDAIMRLSRAEVVVILLGDQPDIDPTLVDRLLDARKKAGRPVAVPKYRYSWGNPVVVDRTLWPRLMSLEGDQGAKQLFRAHPEWVTEVWLEGRPPRDVDTVADVESMRPR